MADATKVLFVSSECYPLIKTGGLADVTGALPLALAQIGFDARVLLPAYPGVADKVQGLRVAAKLTHLFGGPARVLTGSTATGVKVLLLEAAHLFARDGGPYLDATGRDHPDNDVRFAALSYVGAHMATGTIGRWRPALVHAHDWQAGLVAAYLRLAGATVPTVFTIHNLAFQGLFPRDRLGALGLPTELFSVEGVEFHGQISLLKAGLQYADAITTVSPTYAQEILTPAEGAGLDGVLRARLSALTGILNGIDETVWDPQHDPLLPQHFSAAEPLNKALAKTALQAEFGLEQDPTVPLFGVVSRLSHQKGFDLLIEVLPTLLAGGQLVVLGTGDAEIEGALAHAAAAHPGQVGVHIGFDEGRAHRIQAGADVIMVPSRFEPCGLTQLSALRYGSLPLVSRVGGLADTVIDANTAATHDGVATGFVFTPVSADALRATLQRVFALWGDQHAWHTVQQRAMTRDVGWSSPAAQYAALYADLLARRT